MADKRRHRKEQEEMSETVYPLYDSSEVSAREVYTILRRRRWTILATLALALVLGELLTHRTTPVYRARATMLVEQTPVRAAKGADEADIGPLLQPTQPFSLETQVEILESRPLWMKVI